MRGTCGPAAAFRQRSLPAPKAALVLGLCLVAEPAVACTLCHTPQASQLRHVFTQGFAAHLLAIAAPLPVLLSLVWLGSVDRSADAADADRQP